LTRSAEDYTLRTAGSIVGNGQRSSSRTARRRLEGHRDRAIGAGIYAGPAGVGLGEIPLAVIPEMDSEELPVLVRATDWEVLLFPDNWAEKVSEEGDKLAIGPAPVPLKLTVCVLPPPHVIVGNGQRPRARPRSCSCEGHVDRAVRPGGHTCATGVCLSKIPLDRNARYRQRAHTDVC